MNQKKRMCAAAAIVLGVVIIAVAVAIPTTSTSEELTTDFESTIEYETAEDISEQLSEDYSEQSSETQETVAGTTALSSAGTRTTESTTVVIAAANTTETTVETTTSGSSTSYTEAELDLLARLIYAEVGASWHSDELQRMVGSVVLNRVNSSLYPNTIYDVIYQSGQYSPTWNGMINRSADSRAIANAKYVLENGSILPSYVIGQCQNPNGMKVYTTYYDNVLGTTIYFCYL